MVCPFVKTCPRKVDLQHFEGYCRMAYSSCEFFQGYAIKKHTPGEWLKIIEEGEEIYEES